MCILEINCVNLTLSNVLRTNFLLGTICIFLLSLTLAHSSIHINHKCVLIRILTKTSLPSPFRSFYLQLYPPQILSSLYKLTFVFPRSSLFVLLAISIPPPKHPPHFPRFPPTFRHIYTLSFSFNLVFVQSRSMYTKCFRDNIFVENCFVPLFRS